MRAKKPVELVSVIILVGEEVSKMAAYIIPIPDAADIILPDILLDSQIQVSHSLFSVPTRQVFVQSELENNYIKVVFI